MTRAAKNPRRYGNKHRRPFRGPTPKNVYQTVDLGTGGDRHWNSHGKLIDSFLRRRARRNPNRKYIAIDEELSKYYPTAFTTIPNVQIVSRRAFPFLEEMIRKNLRTRHINIDMPLTVGFGSTVHAAITNASRLLLPNGKIFITTENDDNVQKIKELAHKCGLKFRELKNLPLNAKDRRTRYTSFYQRKTIRRIEITYPLKKAFPKKEDRVAMQR
ncbi:MAG: hypothetical protein V1776_02540 [Candidatus Diapherotrites archaeon]